MTRQSPGEDNQRVSEKMTERQAEHTPEEETVGNARDAPGDDATSEDGRTQGRYRRETKADEQAHFFRAIAFGLVVLFAAIPAILLGWLGWSVFSGEFVGLKYVANSLGPWPVGVFITGVFAGFIAVFGFLAKGAFNLPRRKDDEEKESSDNQSKP